MDGKTSAEERRKMWLVSKVEATSRASFGGHGSSVQQAASFPQAAASPASPAGTDVEGLLAAQIQAALASKIKTKIPASPPSEREKRLWDRVVAAEKRSLEAENQRGFYALSMLLFYKLLGFVTRHMLLCAAIFLGALADDRLHAAALSSFGGRFSSSTDHLFIFLFTAVSVLLLTLFRPVRLLCTSIVYVAALWLWAHKLFNTEMLELCVSLQTWHASGIASAVQRHPSLSAFCAFVAASIVYVRSLQSYRYFWRLTEIYVTAAFPIALYFCCKCVQKALKLSSQQATEWMYDPADRIVAPFLSNRFAALGGLFVKAGQWLANMAATPLVWTDHLKKLQDCAPKDSDTYVKAMLEAEFGKNFKDIFLEFEFDPVASASIAQVHKAIMRESGEQVAVKLQHEGVEPMMLLDLDALKRVLAISCWLGGSDWDEVKTITEGWMKEMVHELDFHREVENLREVRRGLKAAGVNVVVPTEVEGHVSRRAFIMDFCEGFRFTDLDQLALWGVDRKALGERAVHAVASQLLEIGVFNSDPHGGNLLCQIQENSAVPVLLDFGNCIRLPEEQRLLYCRLLVALADASMSSVVEATKKLGIITSQTEAHPARDMEYMMMVFRDTGSRKSQIAGLKSFRELRKSQRSADMEALDEETKKNKKKAKAQTQRYPKKMPEEAVLFLRMMLLVRGLCSQLDAELPFLQLFEQHARRALVVRFPTVKRALRALPADQDERSQALSDKVGSHVAPLVREVMAQLVIERPGLGIQASVFVGDACVVDECGGVLGSTDPRPMLRSTRIPLADLARLPWLLALGAAEKKGKIKYSDRLMSLLETQSACTASLADALAHQAIKQDGDERDAFISSPVAELGDKKQMLKKLTGSFASHPLSGARHLPWGAGYVAAAALCKLSNKSEVEALEHYLPGLQAAGELGLEGSSGEDWATLSSGLFSDLRSLASGSPASGSGNIFMGPVLGGVPQKKQEERPAEGSGPDSPGKQESSDTSPKKPLGHNRQSLARSVFEDAGGLLADVGLANEASRWSAELCPDMAMAASARSLAAVLASACPVSQSRPRHSREQAADAAGNSLSFLFSQLAPPARAWDERGLQVIELEDTAHSAVGLGSCGGLLGYAIQWSAPASKPVTAVVLCNQLSMLSVPSQVIARVVDAMRLPRPLGLA